MRIRIEVTSGARRGLRRTFEGPRVSVGRHPDCDLQLDPEVDRAASARHAVFLLAGGRWIVRDVGSRNGTFVDDDPVEGERRLRDGDVVQFGREGPRARVEVLTSDTHEFEEVGEADGAGEAADRERGDGRGEERRRAAAGAGSGDGGRGGSGDSETPETASGAAASADGSGPSGGGSDAAAGGSDAGGSTTDRLRQQVERRGKGLVVLAIVLAAILGAGAAWFFLSGSGASGAQGGSAAGPVSAGGSPGGGEPSAASAERTDSMLRATRQTLDSLRGRVTGLQQALEDSRSRVAEIQQQLRQSRDGASGSGGDGTAERRALERRLDSALTELQRQSELATTDFSAVEANRWRALAQVYIESDGGEVATATGFAVRAEGLLVTSRHVVLEEDGTPAARIGVQFARSDQVWPAELVATHDEADLALIRVRNVEGDVPVIPVLGDEVGTVAEGSPVAVLGYSGGRPAPTSGGASGRLPRPSLSVGLLLDRGEERLRVRGFGAEGGSGSPIFDAEGRLVGVLRGGIDDGSADGRRILVAVPSRVVRSLVETVLERLGS